MEPTERYYDFCVPYNENEKEMRAMLRELHTLGYRTIAIDEKFEHAKTEKKTEGPDIFPAPRAIKHLRDEFKQKLRILQRLTIIFADKSIAHAMLISRNLKCYNLIAGQPRNDEALTYCCTEFNGDIVSFDPDAGSKLLVNRKAYLVGVERGMFFELKYAPAINDTNYRKDLIKLSHNYCLRGKSKNIVISSGAKNVFELRGPHEVANLAFIFNLSDDQGKNAVDRNCRRLFLQASSRRIGMTVMFVKGSGPIVFSDSSTESEEDANEEELADTEEEESESEDSESAASNPSMPTEQAVDNAQPNKKIKTLS